MAAGLVSQEPRAWRSVAEAASAGLLKGPDLLFNGSFSEADRVGQEPHYLYPRDGALPAHWFMKAMPTEKGSAGLVHEDGTGDRRAGSRVLRVEGAWDTQVYQWLPATPGNIYLGMARLKGHSSPGSDAALVFTFLSADGLVLNAAAQSLPKGDTSQWRTLVLGDRAPQGAAWVGLGVGCTRQAAGDWTEAASIELHSMPGEASPQ